MHEKFIPIHIRGNFRKVYLKDIIYIKKDARKILIKVTGSIYEIYEYMENIIKYLDERFYICHKSLIINFDYISHSAKKTICFTNGSHVTMSASNWRLTKKAYIKRLEDKYNVQIIG